MRIVVHDFGGYRFALQLSEALGRRGHEVFHLYCASLQTTPPGIPETHLDGQGRLTIVPIALDEPINKYNFAKRWKQEKAYGKLAASKIAQLAPDIVISANTPLDAQVSIQHTCLRNQIPFIFWLQDLISIATRQILKQKIPVLGNVIGAYYMHVEKKLLQKSSAVIAITEGFREQLQAWHVAADHVSVIPNWAPVAWMPAKPRDNTWAKQQHLDRSFNFMYTGTLGMKHNPELLLRLAQSFKEHENVRVVVVSEGLGASWLSEQKNVQGLTNLLILPYQPAEQLPDVLATGDVLVALLNGQAGKFSVPSKVLTYLCAERALLLALPLQNQAAQLVAQAEAGMLSAAEDFDGFLQNAHALHSDEIKRLHQAKQARLLAEQSFAIEPICDRFEQIIQKCGRIA